MTGSLLANLFGLCARRRHHLDRLRSVVAAPLPDLTADYAWQGRLGAAKDFLPRLMTLGPNGWSTNACNGRGMAMTTAFGRSIARWLAGGANDLLPVPVTKPDPVPTPALSSLAISAWRRSIAGPTGGRWRGRAGPVRDLADHESKRSMSWLRDSDLAAVVAAHRAATLGAATDGGDLAAFFARCHGALESAGENRAAPTETAPPVTAPNSGGWWRHRGSDNADLTALADAFAALAGRLTWRRRQGLEGAANFADGHANADLIGFGRSGPPRSGSPGRRLGGAGRDLPQPQPSAGGRVSGAQRRCLAGKAPGRGSAAGRAKPYIAVPHIVHAMRAGPEVPLLALWMLWLGA